MKSKTSEYEKPEYLLQCAFTDYIDKYYPYINYCANLSGVNIGSFRGSKNSKKGVRKGYPDYAIYEPNAFYSGLFIEFKSKGRSVKKKSDQERVIDNLRRSGYCVYWVDDYTLAIRLLDWYLKLPKTNIISNRPVFTENFSGILEKMPSNTFKTNKSPCIEID